MVQTLPKTEQVATLHPLTHVIKPMSSNPSDPIRPQPFPIAPDPTTPSPTLTQLHPIPLHPTTCHFYPTLTPTPSKCIRSIPSRVNLPHCPPCSTIPSPCQAILLHRTTPIPYHPVPWHLNPTQLHCSDLVAFDQVAPCLYAFPSNPAPPHPPLLIRSYPIYLVSRRSGGRACSLFDGWGCFRDG